MSCKCTHSYLYDSFSIGPYIYDTITLSSTFGRTLKAKNPFMGCIMENQGHREAISGGVLGLGQGPNSFSAQTSRLYGGKFSYYLRDYLDPTTMKSSLVFGDMIEELGSSILRGPIQYTLILRGISSLYYNDIEEIIING